MHKFFSSKLNFKSIKTKVSVMVSVVIGVIFLIVLSFATFLSVRAIRNRT